MISIIVPLYNGEKYIERLFNCLELQSSKDFEVIFVNDGSSDSSALIIENLISSCTFKAKLITQQNAGVSCARNVGLNNATGDYIMFVDVDDLITTDRIEFLQNIAINTKSDVVLSGTKIIEDFKTDNRYSLSDFICQCNSYKIYNTTNILNAFLDETVHSGVCGGIISRAIIEDNNLRFVEGCKYSEDLHFMWRVFACSKTVCVSDKVTYLYMWVPNSAMSKFDKERFQGYDEIKLLYSFMENKVPSFALSFKQHAASRIMWSIARQAACRLSYKEFKSFFKGRDLRGDMHSLTSYSNLGVRITSILYLICPFCFYFIARIHGRKNIHK